MPQHRVPPPAILLAAAILTAATGCQPRDPAVRDATAALKPFVAALYRQDDAYLRAHATCIVSGLGIRDARIRYLEPPRAVRFGALDSLAGLYGEAHRLADSLYAATPDSAPEVEDRFSRTRELGRRAAVVRAAIRAAEQSGGGAPPDTATLCQSIRGHVMIRAAGKAVGPGAIERDVIVRLLRTPGGSWVVYAFDLASDPPGPLPF